MKRNFHKILFILTILVFVILLAQTLWHPLKFKKLEGVTDKVELPTLNFKDFSDGSINLNSTLISLTTTDLENLRYDYIISISGRHTKKKIWII